MNPETTITTQDINNICNRNGITFSHSNRVTDGFSNEVHLINSSIIIKVCTRLDNIDRFYIEPKVLAHKDNILKPKLIASDFSKQVIAHPYILMEYVAGKSLGSVWHTLDDVTRENLIKDICTNLKFFNDIPRGNIFGNDVKWGDQLASDFEKKQKNLVSKKTLSAEQVQSVRLILSDYKPSFNNTSTKIVFWDIHFDNFIVNSDNQLSALIDLESVEQTALDYPLFVVQKLSENPKLFLSLENEQYADRSDYKYLMSWYKKYYPEMFDFEVLDKRIAIYRLLDVVHLLQDWPNVKELHKDFERFVSILK